ncbi:MAG: hypothetical protein U5N53_06805 [Mycobacterium sp.]|nr:hypothetical protein [Mycobacterium sp.]
MNQLATLRRRSVGAALVVAAIGSVGSSLVAPASADPALPKGVRVQCSGFYGPNTVWPHYLTGCVRRNGTTGTGQTNRIAPGSERITWDKPFVKGKSMDLVGIASTIVSYSSPACPADHPVEANVSGTIGTGSKWANSPVTATICGNATDFALKPGSYFVIGKTPKDMNIDDFNDEP